MNKKALIEAVVSALTLSFMSGVMVFQEHHENLHEVHADGTHIHNGITFNQEWTSTNKLPTEEGNYYLANDVRMTSADYIWTVKKNISLDLNGYSIVAKTESYQFNVINVEGSNTTLNICDCGTQEHKAVWNDENKNYMVVDDGADPANVAATFTGGYITNFFGNSVINVAKGNTLNFYGGTIIGNGKNKENGSGFAYAIKGNAGSINMYGGNIIGNYLGGIEIYSTSPTALGTLKVLGGNISYNKETGIVCDNLDEDLILENVNISYNEVQNGNGGAGGLHTCANTIIKSGTVISHNKTTYNGGGIVFKRPGATNVKLTIEGGEISNNIANRTGGGIFIGDSFGVGEGSESLIEIAMSGGEIKNNTAGEGGGVGIFSYSGKNVQFNMTGGKINNNTVNGEGWTGQSGKGGGIYLSAGSGQINNIVNISGGEIKNNIANVTGGGISVGQNTTLALSSNPDISGNKAPSESINDEIYMENSSYITIPSALDDETTFGIRMASPGVFTKGLTSGNTYLPHFVSLDEDYSVYVNSSQQLYLAVAHTHSWSYAANGTKITASCSSPDCPVTSGLELELQAPANLVYDGTAKEATLKEGYSIAAFPNPEIKYYQDANEVTSCINAGSYSAKVTFGDATASVDFEITKATPTPTAVSDRNATYGQSLSEIDLPDGWAWNSPTDKVGNVGLRQHKATFTPEDSVNYKTVEQDVNVIVAKANPEYTVPTGLTALINKTLSTVNLPAGWSWDDPTTNVGSELGNKVFKGTFTPEDTDNYNLVEHVDITVQVVDHEHNWSYTASGATITASCSTPECDVNTGLTLTLKAPSGDMRYDGNARVATIEEGYNAEAFPSPQIKYFKDNSEVNECINVGQYIAKVTYGNAVAMVEFEILGKTMSEDGVSIEVDDAVVADNIELRVEVRTDVVEKEIAEDYAKIQAKLADNEEISKVYDVKLVQIVSGVETVIQPSDIKPGLVITVRMAIPEGIDMNNVRILHIHDASTNDMEFVSNYVIDGNDLVFEIDRLSQFAFITKVNAPAPQPGGDTNNGGLNGGIIALIIILSILAVLGIIFLLLFFAFAKFIIVKDKEDKDKIVRAIKIGKDHKDDKDYFWMLTFTFKKELRPEDEVFNSKKDAEDFLKEQQNKQ